MLHYDYAIHMARILDWSIQPPAKLWITIEHAASHTPLEALPWAYTGTVDFPTPRYHTIGATIAVWKKIVHLPDVSPGISQRYPILHSIRFP
ncbi:Hypothetical predicted protein, partial [Pelobates cultripes]